MGKYYFELLKSILTLISHGSLIYLTYCSKRWSTVYYDISLTGQTVAVASSAILAMPLKTVLLIHNWMT